jgi:F-type H+-transporting ATPase subunit gamma
MAEIADILRAMKNLAYLETRKLQRLLDNQRAAVRQVNDIAADFLAFHPEVLPAAAWAERAYLIIGSRRGFCGDFNERLLSRLSTELTSGGDSALILGVGRKLCLRLQGHFAPVQSLEGADVAEEIPRVLREIVAGLDAQQARGRPLALTVLWHSGTSSEVSLKSLLPPFEDHRRQTKPAASPPLLNLTPQAFFLGLVEHYLFTALHALLYESLLVENQRRLHHLDAAVHHLEEGSERLRQRIRGLRQEEMIEEIEVILLNATTADGQ